MCVACRLAAYEVEPATYAVALRTYAKEFPTQTPLAAYQMMAGGASRTLKVSWCVVSGDLGSRRGRRLPGRGGVGRLLERGGCLGGEGRGGEGRLRGRGGCQGRAGRGGYEEGRGGYNGRKAAEEGYTNTWN